MSELRSLILGERGGETPFLIAEIGINHGGSFREAQRLIIAAKAAGVQGVKFQYRNIDSAYVPKAREIGDEIIQSEVARNFLSPAEIIALTKEAKSLGLYAGCSFFHLQDCYDFQSNLLDFDFFKVPSVELLNFNLTDFLISLNRPVLISTGAHHESEIEEALTRLIAHDNWYPLHCVSNYPVAFHNSSFSYIAHLQNRWQVPVGLSSHERYWEVIVLAMKWKPRIIERHITLDKKVSGLDQSSSSTPEEFARLVQVLREMVGVEEIPIEKRVPNHGEVINRQNLGRSLYFTAKQEVGRLLDKTTLEYRSPGVGLNSLQLQRFSYHKLCKTGEPHSPVTSSHFERSIQLRKDEIEAAKGFGLSLPVRLHDFSDISQQLPIGSFELHLSFREVSELSDFAIPIEDVSLTVHLPDYVDPLQLMDPYSPDDHVATLSRDLTARVSDFVARAQDTLGKQILVVSSFSRRNHATKKQYFEMYREYLTQFAEKGVQICLQWLPPFAWYFGGSEPVDVMNGLDDVSLIKEFDIPLCMDTSHLLLGANYFRFDPLEVLQTLRYNIKHFHVSDAQGYDGEGAHFDFSKQSKRDFFRNVLTFEEKKVIEVWQGHLNDREGFIKAIKDLIELGRSAHEN
jgi:sialic acid synthase SpsE/sugar phosphate isomerase/epimerase